jgi:hypothetical protein
MKRQSSRFKFQEILNMKPIPNEVILVHMWESYLHKIIIIIIIIIIIPGFLSKILILYNSKLFKFYAITSVMSDCQKMP